MNTPIIAGLGILVTALLWTVLDTDPPEVLVEASLYQTAGENVQDVEAKQILDKTHKVSLSSSALALLLAVLLIVFGLLKWIG
ncbi:MAG: hypothetical protein ACP5E4_04045 [Candidatus Aenigmatarchaeota archaeon]